MLHVITNLFFPPLCPKGQFKQPMDCHCFGGMVEVCSAYGSCIKDFLWFCSTKEKSGKDNIVVEMKNDNTEEAVLLGVNGEKQTPRNQVDTCCWNEGVAAWNDVWFMAPLCFLLRFNSCAFPLQWRTLPTWMYRCEEGCSRTSLSGLDRPDPSSFGPQPPWPTVMSRGEVAGPLLSVWVSGASVLQLLLTACCIQQSVLLEWALMRFVPWRNSPNTPPTPMETRTVLCPLSCSYYQKPCILLTVGRNNHLSTLTRDSFYT